MGSRISNQIDSLVRKSTEMAEKGRDAAGKARARAGEAAGKARTTAEKAAEKAYEKSGLKEHISPETLSKISDKVHKENMIRAAETVRDELRHLILGQTLSDIAEVKDQNDELRRKMDDMQKIYDKKIADLQAQLGAARSTPRPAPRTPSKTPDRTADK